MKKLIPVALLVALLSAGCATQTQLAREYRYDESGEVTADIKTKTRVRTFLTSQQSAKSIKSTNSEDAQTVEIADLHQESDVTKLVESVVKAAVESAADAAVEAVNPLE